MNHISKRRAFLQNEDVLSAGMAAYNSELASRLTAGDSEQDAKVSAKNACLAAKIIKQDELILAQNNK